MTQKKKQIVYTIIGFSVGIVLALISILLAGAGHGFILPAIVTFPYSMLGANLFPGFYGFFLVLALIQYPYYFFLISKIESTSNLPRAVKVTIALHILSTVLCFYS